MKGLLRFAGGTWALAALFLLGTETGRSLTKRVAKAAVKGGLLAVEKGKEAYEQLQDKSKEVVGQIQDSGMKLITEIKPDHKGQSVD